MNDDYISRKETLSRFTFYNGDIIPEKDVDGFTNTISFKDAKSVIRSIPSADVRPVVYGEWRITSGQIENAVCSCCGVHFQAYYSDYQYCPRCGADMRGKANE